MSLYIRTLALDDPPFRKRYLIPLAVAIAGSIFLKFDYVETPYGNYSWGSYAFVVFASGYLYFFAGMVLLFRRRKHIDIKSFRAIYMALLFQLAAVIVQGIFPTILISGIGLTVIVVSLFYSVESPDAILIEKLADERARADSANKAKSTFLAQMSHDIRTPMNAVLGMNEMILRKTNDPEILEYASGVRDSGNILLSLINEILDFSKIEDGKMEILSVEYDTARLIVGLVNSVSGRAASKGLLFRTDIDESIPCRLKGDDVRFTQVVMNILTNAVKYTEEGTVTLTFRMEGRKEGEAVLLVSVEDTGIGIRPEDMDKLTTSFSRIEEERNRHVEGTGLGMAIVDRLLKMMGSSIQVESEYGKGSKFSFVIRQGIVDDTPMGDYRDGLKRGNTAGSDDIEFDAPGAKILVVDDNEMNLKVAWHLLKLCGITPAMASSGEAAIEEMRQNQYDIVFLDHMMPGMDGVETIHQLKKEKLVPGHTAVIVLTANAVAGARETYLAEGFADYLSKPMEVKDLVEKLKQYLPKEAYGHARMEHAPEEKPGEAEILEFAPEEEPGEAEILEFAPEEEFGVMEFLPDENEKEENGAGRVAFDRERLEQGGIDTEMGMNYCGGEKELYVQMLTDFSAACEEKTAALDAFFKQGDWHGYQVAVHAAKSNARMIGAARVSELAKVLEDAAEREDEGYLNENHGSFLSAYRQMAELLSGR